MTAPEIRQQFLNFFKSKEHQIVPSAPIVVKNDPTLLFTNAGMNQFKDYFLGNKQPEHTRVADTQKCLRVSGKHNDLEEVGVDTYHHTMFEMLGNWSFGDYFKKEAIAWSWELLTDVYKLDKERLYVTIFEGDEKEGLAKDEEAFAEWKKYVPEERILPGNKKDNFWEMGDTGPCGPSSEIHFDSRNDEERKQVNGATLVNKDNPQVIEIWNNVFIQYNRLKDGSLETLPAKHVDTGMGFERLVRVIQGAQSNYDTDVFSGTIKEIEKIVNKKYIAEPSLLNKLDLNDMDFEKDPDDFKRKIDVHIEKSIELKLIQKQKESIAFRVLSDHIRAISFTIADGQLPSNTGAGYVIRRILRRAVRYYYSYLDYKQPLLFQLIPVIAKQFEDVFPELQQQAEFISRVVKEEEEGFLRTLEKGLIKIEKYFDTYGQESFRQSSHDNSTESMLDRMEEFVLFQDPDDLSKPSIAGKVVFDLLDTYGFPLDLTQLIARERGWGIDQNGFEKAMQQQKNRSRAATALDTEDWVVLNNNNKTAFVGYDSLEAKTHVLKYRKVKAKGKELYQIVLDKTPFYAESGGQVGDTGFLIPLSTRGEGQGVRVIDTKKENDLIIHVAEEIPDDLSGEVTAIVNKEQRQHIALHHSATHLLHAALRNVLGTHVAQKGSLVNDEYLRFDFSHFAKVANTEMAQVEAIVNEKIRANIPVVIKYMSKEEAMQSGAMALFGEKYGDVVRVVTIDPAYSVELCGGTHVGATGELGFFKIKHETAVAAGVRRIEAVTGKAAAAYVDEQLTELNGAKAALKNPKQLSKSIDNLLSEQSELKKRLESLEAKLLNSLEGGLMQQTTTINDVSFIGEIVDVSSADALKKLSIDLSKKINGAVVLCAGISGKASVAVAFAESLTSKGFDANKIIKEQVAPLIKGGGGGQKNSAVAGGQDSGAFQQIIHEVKALL